MSGNICEDLIKQDIQQNCTDPIVAGIESNGVIINRKHVDMSAITWESESTEAGSAKRKNVITSFPLVQGAKAYKVFVPGKQPFNGTTTELEEGTNRNTFTKNVAFVILDHGPDVCENIIDGLANGEFVLVHENKYKSLQKDKNKGDSAYEVSGLFQGLRASTLSNDKYSEDTEGGWEVVLTEAKSPKSAVFLYNKDLATTKTMVEGLTTTV